MIDIVEKHLGSHTDVESGEQYMYHCPVCHHKNDRLSVNYNKNVFHCWTCGFAGRSVVNLLYYMKASEADINTVKEFLGEKKTYEGNSSISKLQYEVYRTLDDDDKNKSYIPRIEQPEFWVPLDKPKDMLEKRAYKYALKRGMSPYEIKLYNLQYNEEFDSIDIPSYNSDKQLNYYVRHFFTEGYYQNPLGHSKMNIIFNEHMLDFSQPIIITEGFYDAVTIGFNAVPILGKFVPKPLIQKMVQYDTPFVYLFMDGDAHEEVVGLHNYLSYIGIKSKIIQTSGDEDPNSLGREKVEMYLNDAKQVDFKDKIEMILENK